MNKYEPTISDYIKREVDLLPINQCRVDILNKSKEDNTMMGCFGLEENKPVIQFYTDVIQQNIDTLGSKIITLGGPQKYIQKAVRHECRHYMQYEYFMEHGIDYNFALDIENKFPYGKGPLEEDAERFSNGDIRDLEELTRKYYSEGNGYQTFKDYDKSKPKKKNRRKK